MWALMAELSVALSRLTPSACSSELPEGSPWHAERKRTGRTKGNGHTTSFRGTPFPRGKPIVVLRRRNRRTSPSPSHSALGDEEPPTTSQEQPGVGSELPPLPVDSPVLLP